MGNQIPFDARGLMSKLAERRRRLGLSQRELERRAGLSDGYVSQLERGKRNPSAQVLISLCNVLETTPNALMIDSLPKHLYGESLSPDPLGARRPSGSLRNTLSNWLLADTPDESLMGEDDTDVSGLPPIGFLSLVDDIPDISLTDEDDGGDEPASD